MRFPTVCRPAGGAPHACRGRADPIQGTRVEDQQSSVRGHLGPELRSRVRLDHGVCEGCAALSGHRAGDAWAEGQSALLTLGCTARHTWDGYTQGTRHVQTWCPVQLSLFPVERLTHTPPGHRPLRARDSRRHQSRLPSRAGHGASTEVCRTYPRPPGPGPDVTAPFHPGLP